MGILKIAASFLILKKTAFLFKENMYAKFVKPRFNVTVEEIQRLAQQFVSLSYCV